jgi:hypothetical protein
MPSTFTLNVGATPADVIYTHSHYDGRNRIYTAPSATNDLSGRRILTIGDVVSAGGLRRTPMTWKLPVAIDGVYSQHIQFNGVLIRPDSIDLDLVDELLESQQEFFAITDVRSAIASASIGS